MSAAEKLKPQEQGERVVSLLSSTSAKFPGFADRTLASNGYTVTRYATLDEILNSPELSRPGLVLLEVGDEPDIQQAHIFLKTQERAMAHGRLKVVIFTNIKHQDVRARFKNIPIADYILHPLPDRTFLFKLDLQAKILTKVLEAEMKRPDPNFDLHSARQRRGKYNLKVIGPSPTRGKWQLINNAPQGKVRWRWIRNPAPSPAELENELKKRDWQYEGTEPPRWDEKEQLWNLESDEPVLEKIENGNKTFSSNTAAWLDEDIFTIKQNVEIEINANRDGALFSQEEPLKRQNLSLKQEPKKEEYSTKLDQAKPSDALSITLEPISIKDRASDISGKNEAIPNSTSEQNNIGNSSIMDLRSKGTTEKSKVDAQDSAQDNAKKSVEPPLIDLNSFRESSWQAKKSSKVSGVVDVNEQDQAAVLRDRFKNKVDTIASATPHVESKEKTNFQIEQKEMQDRRTKEKFDSPEAVHHDLKPDYIKSKKSDDKTSTTNIDSPTAVKNEKSTYQHNESAWSDNRSKDTGELAKKINDRQNEPLELRAKSSKNTPEQKVVEGSVPAADSQDDSTNLSPTLQPKANETNAKPDASSLAANLKLKKVDASSEVTEKITHQNKEYNEEAHARSITPDKHNPEETLRERRGDLAPEGETRVAGASNLNTNQEEKNLYHVVKERVHYLKTLAELGDDNSTWERAEIYRVYLGGKGKYYGLNTIEDALPIWVYVGETAPEYIESIKSWKFFDNIPVKYDHVADLPTPVLELLMELRRRDKVRKVEEIRKKNLFTDEHGQKTPDPETNSASEKNEPELKSQESNVNTMGAASVAESEAKPEDIVEHVRVESFVDKVIGIFGKLFGSRR